MNKNYEPASVQAEIADIWEREKCFHAEPTDPGEPYAIVIPPPNVTAALHLGHALNNTLQDILVRKARMEGKNAIWLPGTDHAGIATQTVVEKRVLKEEGKRRIDFPRDEFVKKIQAWKDEYEQVILGQLKAMGCSCDWDRCAFTMDEARARAVREAFFQLFKAGLIYRGKRLVNWDPATQTALADDEVEMEEIDGFFYYLQYPLADGSGHVTVATTRPETMLGDTAVAINPKDPRAAALKGKMVRLPIVNREIPIIEDDYVVLPVALGGDPSDPKAQFATGFLKVTPAHDPNDYDIGQRHKLPIINVMAPDGSISDKHGWSDVGDGEFLLGLDRYEAREAVVEWFRTNKLLEEVKPYRHSVGHSYRSHVAIEPYLSDQWYCKVTDPRLAGAALSVMAADQKVGHRDTEAQREDEEHVRDAARLSSPKSHATEELRFFPERYAKTFQNWHENIRDWCISRQLWWGHRIPVWTLQLDAVNGAPIPPETFASYVDLLHRIFAHAGLPDEIAIRTDYDTHRLMLATRSSDAQELLQDLNRFWDLGLKPAGQAQPASVFLRNNEELTALANPLTKLFISLEQDPDVLDTWFSSALWPLSTLGWPEDTAEMRKWNPTSVLCTAREIITLWVSRMVMFNHFFKGQIPFSHVFIHAMIQDGHGQKMSKTLGNGVDPLDIIASHGTDAMRFTLTTMATNTQDVRMPVDLIDPYTNETMTPTFARTEGGHTVMQPNQRSGGDANKLFWSPFAAITGIRPADTPYPTGRNTSSKFDLGRGFCNKLWSIARFVFMSIEGIEPEPIDELKWSMADRWIVSRLNRTITEVNDALADYRFDQYARAVYAFVENDFSGWYVEFAKPQLRDEKQKRQTAAVLASVMDASLRLLHPAIPFITEKLWEALNAIRPERGLPGRIACPSAPRIIRAQWPIAGDTLEAAEHIFPRVQDLVTAIRNLRSEHKVEPKRAITLHIKAPGDRARQIELLKPAIEQTTTSRIASLAPELAEPAGSTKLMSAGCEVFVEGLVDESAEQARVAKRRDELTKQISAMEGRLANAGYIAKAPPKLVQETKDQLAAAKAELAALGQ